jgi:hypothetical protein
MRGEGMATMTGEAIGWRSPDQSFWKRWRSEKAATKAEGYRVNRRNDGSWRLLAVVQNIEQAIGGAADEPHLNLDVA